MKSEKAKEFIDKNEMAAANLVNLIYNYLTICK